MSAKRITRPENLGDLNKDQLVAYLGSDQEDKVAIWNKWREINQWVPLDLCDVTIQQAKLDGIVLCGVLLDRADLSETYLNGAILSYFDMREFPNWKIVNAASLIDAALVRVHMKKAVLNGVHCEKSRFWEANLEGAQMQDTHLEEAGLDRACLDGAFLQNAHLENVNLLEASLRGASLSGVNLENATLGRAHMEGSMFVPGFDNSPQPSRLNNAHMDGAHLENAFFMNAYLEKTIISDAHLDNTKFINCHLEGANLRRSHFEGAEFSGSFLDNADLRESYLRDVSLTTVMSLQGIRLYRAHLSGLLDLRNDQLIDNRQSTIWEHTQGRFHDAKDVYKMLKGFFEDAGDYEGVNWAYEQEQIMEKLMYAPVWSSILYPEWGKHLSLKAKNDYGEPLRSPKWVEWLRLELSEKISGYGLSLFRPLVCVAFTVIAFGIIYCLFGLTTSVPGCGYADLSLVWREGCQADFNLFDNIYFSLAALTSTQLDYIQPYTSHVGLLMTVETLIGIALTGLFGFVLGNKLRFS